MQRLPGLLLLLLSALPTTSAASTSRPPAHPLAPGTGAEQQEGAGLFSTPSSSLRGALLRDRAGASELGGAAGRLARRVGELGEADEQQLEGRLEAVQASVKSLEAAEPGTVSQAERASGSGHGFAAAVVRDHKAAELKLRSLQTLLRASQQVIQDEAVSDLDLGEAASTGSVKHIRELEQAERSLKAVIERAERQAPTWGSPAKMNSTYPMPPLNPNASNLHLMSTQQQPQASTQQQPQPQLVSTHSNATNSTHLPLNPNATSANIPAPELVAAAEAAARASPGPTEERQLHLPPGVLLGPEASHAVEGALGKVKEVAWTLKAQDSRELSELGPA